MIVAKFSLLGKWSTAESVSVTANSECEVGLGSLENMRQAVYSFSPNSMTCYVVCHTFDVLLSSDSPIIALLFQRSSKFLNFSHLNFNYKSLSPSSSTIVIFQLSSKQCPLYFLGMADALTWRGFFFWPSFSLVLIFTDTVQWWYKAYHQT